LWKPQPPTRRRATERSRAGSEPSHSPTGARLRWKLTAAQEGRHTRWRSVSRWIVSIPNTILVVAGFNIAEPVFDYPPGVAVTHVPNHSVQITRHGLPRAPMFGPDGRRVGSTGQPQSGQPQTAGHQHSCGQTDKCSLHREFLSSLFGPSWPFAVKFATTPVQDSCAALPDAQSCCDRFVKPRCLAPSLAGAFVAYAASAPPPVSPRVHRRSPSAVEAGPCVASRSAHGKGR
jgi:hypothetical protein